MISEKDYDEIYQKGYEDGKNDNITKIEYSIKPSFTTRKLNQLQDKINRIDAFIKLHTTADSDYDGNMWYEIYDISESQFIEGLKDIL